ncbi:hypothetical protein PG984_006594 [Apiospora sp. TS-2023a]
MPPSYPTKQTGFGDERRRSSGYNGGGSDSQSYRPQDRDRDRELARSGDKSSSRRESDPRDYLDDRERSRDRERDRVKTRDDPLQLPTNIPTGPRIASTSAKSSPMSKRVNAPPPFRPLITTKDPKLQEIFKKVWDWEESLRKRILVSAQRDKKKKEFEERNRSLQNLDRGNRNDNFSVIESLQRLKEHDKKDWEVIDKRYKAFDETYAEYLETIAAVIFSVTMQATPNSASTQTLDSSALAAFEKKTDEKFDTTVAALEKKMEEKFNAKVAALEKKMDESIATKTAGLEKDLSRAQKAIEQLKSARTQAEEKAQELQCNLDKALKTVEEIDQKSGASAAEILSGHAALKVQQNQLQETNGKIQEEVTVLTDRVSKVSREATGREAEVDSAIATIRTAISTKASTSNLEDVKDEHSADLDDLKRQAKEHEDQLTALSTARTSPFLVGINEKLETLVDEVSAMEQLRNDVQAVLHRTAKLEDDVRDIDITAIIKIVDEWEEYAITLKIPQLEDNVEHLRHETDKLKGQSGRLVQEPTPPVPDDGLREEMRKEIQDSNRQKAEEMAQLRATFKSNSEKLVAFVQNLLQKQGVSTAELLDNLTARTEKLESKNDRNSDTRNSEAELQAQNRDGLMTTVQFDARIQALKDELYSLLAEQVNRDVKIPCHAQLDGFRHQLNDHNGRVERLSLEVGVMNTQFSHVWTKPLWDQISLHVDQNYSAFGPRIENNARKLAAVEEKIALLLDRVAPAPPKRPASPAGRPASSEGASKRQRLDNNTASARNGSFGEFRPGAI